MQRLSTGLRVNSAKDDAAALAISTGLVSQIKGMSQAIKNVNDGISLTQTAESALGNVVNILQRMRELAVQAANGTLTTANRAAIQLEYDANINQINSVLGTSDFNGIKLFDGSASALQIQSGAGVDSKDTISIPKITAKSLLGVDATENVINGASQQAAVSGSQQAVTNGSQQASTNTNTSSQVAGTSSVNNNSSNSGYTDYLQFDGTGQSVSGSITNIPVGNSPRTFEMIVQVPATSTSGTLFQYGTANTYQNFAFVLTNGRPEFWGFHMDYLTSTTINDGNYHKLAITFNGNNISMYVDGAQISSSTTNNGNLFVPGSQTGTNFSDLNTTPNTQFVIGNYNFGGGNLNANIKQLAIFDAALTQPQIAALPTSLTGTEANLVANYDFQKQTTVGGSPVAATIINSVNNGDPLTYNGWTLQQAPPAQPSNNQNSNASSSNQTPTQISSNQANNAPQSTQSIIDDVKTADDATQSLKTLDDAIGKVTDIRTYLGAMQNSMQAVVDNLTSGVVNAQQSNGRLIDTDYTVATSELSRSQIISQAATAMLAQANQSTQLVLQLIKQQ
jgi:flagellin